MGARNDKSKVAILMCTYNGGRFLHEQLASFLSQNHEHWELWVSDDGSTDDTLDIVRGFGGGEKRVTVVPGPRSGFAANFLSLLRHAGVDAEYFAWSDQDDIWFPDKLSRAIARLQMVDPEIPAVYSGRTELVNAAGEKIRLSRCFKKMPSFRNALCQNIGGGNTMVLNRAARELLNCGEIPEVVAHDWWAYQLITGAGGVMLYDPEPVLQYRQYGNNQIGENLSFRARMIRLHLIFSGEYRKWNEKNINALACRRDSLSPENIEIYDSFVTAFRCEEIFTRLKYLRKSGIYRQSILEDMILRAASLLNRYP